MKTIYKTPILMMLAIAVLISSCGKKDSPTPLSTDISLVAGTWTTNYWGNVQGNVLTFSVDKNTTNATVTSISGNGYGFAAGDLIYSTIKPNADGTFSCGASYSPTGSGLSTRNATMSLQNSNTQLTVYYPAINSSFPAITYIFTRQGQ
jgi:hypothetical protein